MTRSIGGRWLVLRRLLALVLLLGGVTAAHAGSDFCSGYPVVNGFHVIDGNDPALTPLTLPSSIGMDADCRFENFPISAKWPQGLTSTLNFKSDGFLVVFENLYFGGNMACATTTTHIWFVNNAIYNPNNSCQSLFIPVEAVQKQTPGPTAAVGVPFTYTITVPVMFDPSTGTTLPGPSANTLSNATIYDDLSAIGASATYIGNTAFLVNGGTRTAIGSLTLGAAPGTLSSLGIPASDNTKHIVFSADANSVLGTISPGTQIEIQMTVVLDDVASNVAGTQFTNTAKWWFGRVISGTSYAPLPGESGVSPPMTIVEPGLTLQKSSTLTNLNVGTAAPFRLNVQNAGGGDAWNATVTDVLPTGMCAFDPTPTVTARVFASDGVTPVSGVLAAGTDYTVTYSGCQLGVTMLSAATRLAPTQRLIVNYQARLDAGTGPGLTFTNVAGATQWYGAASGTAGRRQYNRTLSNGTPGTLDFQDAFTVTSTTQGYFFLKSVGDLTSGAPVATTAFTGDRLRYTLQIQNYTFPRLNNITITDDLDALNATAAFVPGSLALASSDLPAGVTLTVNPTGGSKGTGSITISGLDLLKDQQYQVQFDVTLASGVANGANVLNQASLTGTDEFGVAWSGVSDNPNVNGPSLLGTTADVTSVQVYAPGPLAKAITQANATIGQQFKYRITVPATPSTVPLYDVHILDNLGLSAAKLSFVSASVVSGGTWNLTNTGSATNLVLQDATTGIDIPAGGQAVIDITVVLQNVASNANGLAFTNSASYTYNKINGDNATQGTGGSATTAAMTVVEPSLRSAKTVSYVLPAGKAASAPAAAGDVLQYTVTLTNSGTAPAYDTDVMDLLPSNLSLVAGSATASINGVAVSGFVAQPTVLPSGALVWGAQNGDGLLDIPVGGTLVLTYRANVLSANGTPITNSVYSDWGSINGGSAGERNGAGCPSVTAPNTYCTGPATSTLAALDPTALAKTVGTDTWTTAPSTATDATLRVGDTVLYTLSATLREGTTQNVVLTDTLPAGMAFDSVVSINGDTTSPYSAAAPFSYADFTGPVISGNTVTFNFGDVVNAVDNNAGNNVFVIQYRARVVNTIAALPVVQALRNDIALNYAMGGAAATPKTSNASINVWQPVLSVSKSAAPAGGDNVLAAGESVAYTVSIQNTGNAPAYNPQLQDILPVGMRNTTPTVVSVSLVNAGTALPSVTPTYNGATGVATWNFVSGVAGQYAIAPGETLRLVYQAKADATLGAGMVLANRAQVQHYFSLDASDPNASYRKDYGATSTATVQLTTASATALAKQALVTSAAIGQPFTYRITIPATPQPTALNDVRVLDEIGPATTGVSLAYVSASARLASNAKTWATLANGGTASSLILRDATSGGGLDIPAGDQLIVDVVVVLGDDIVNNTAGKQFTNTANYTYNSVNNDNTTQANGAPGASGAVTIVAPSLTLQKSGPATMRTGVPGTFTLDVRNTGMGTAWNVVLSDILPNVTTAPTGGMCGAAPTNVTARVYQADGTTPVSANLVNGTDFTTSFAAAPACTLKINMLSAAAAVAPTQRLIVTYGASLDAGSSSGITLTNVAGATEWRSANPAAAGSSGAIHTYANTLTNGTPGVLDFQDAHALTTESPVLEFRKTVVNVTTGQNPGSNARPGDVMQYTVTVRNVSTLPVSAATLTDELDHLNAVAMFAPGSLRLDSAPAGTTSNVSLNGGAKGTGLLEVRGLNIAAAGSAGDSLTIVYEARLAPVIKSGSAVLNQAQLASATNPTINSDDPNVNGPDNPAVIGDEDPTRTVVASKPLLQVKKTSQDMTGDPAILRPGDHLRYTITAKNIGNENAVGVTIRDLVPANTSYVAGSTTLDGVAVPDAGSVSPLQAGLRIHAPEDSTPGAMRADASSTTANVATITFDVQVNAGVLDGTLISNQGFANGSGAGSGVFPEVPSDDPRTPAVGDPTRDIVGPYALLVARKTVALVGDVNANGVLDPLEVVRYTISIDNLSGLAATGVALTDLVPANTTYVAGTVTLNGAPVGQPDGGVSPLIAGIPATSPSSAAGTIAPHSSAVFTFDVRVNAGVAAGTVISNQGTLATELGSQLTDADGDSSNGYQPTTIIVGSAQQVSITKAVQVVGGGDALPGSQLNYLVTVTNTGKAAVTSVVITDDLGVTPLPTQVAYVAGSATLNGSTTGVSVTGALLRADFAAAYGSLAPGASAQLRFRVQIANGLPLGTLITNTAQVAWNTPTLTASASASIAVGAAAGTASLNGSAWHDANLNKALDSGETPLQGWTVDVLRNKALLGTVTTDASGQYAIKGLLPTVTPADQFTLRFNAPGAGANTAKLGRADSPFVNGMQVISGINAPSGSNLQNLNLPLQPNGVTYDSIVRTPVVGATLDMVRAGSAVPLSSACFDDPVQQGQVTPAGGFYKFELNFSDPSCPSGGDYLIRVTPPLAYMPGESKAIPPLSDAGTPPFSVQSCPGTSADAIPATATYCESQPSDAAPGLATIAAPGTNYYLRLMLNSSVMPGTSQIYNNHIAIDPRLANAVTITKVAGLQNAPRGQLVPYTITVTNTMAVTLTRLSVVDTFPAGFKYVPKSARVDGQPVEPTVVGNQLTWSNVQLATNAKRTIQLLLIVGSGVSEGQYVNRAQVFAPLLGTTASGEATATVRVVADPTLDCTDVIGKVFDDVNLNGYQDEGERGLPGVRLVTTSGLIVTTDPYGRFHVTCAVVPDPDRGSNFILKVDDRSLPAGYRLTSENPQVQRATRGKMIKFNFGAAIHRVVKLDLADGVFEPGTANMRIQWKQRMTLLQNELKKATSVLRLSYLAENESASLVKERLEAIRHQIETTWKREGGTYDLTIETEVFWRTGTPR